MGAAARGLRARASALGEVPRVGMIAANRAVTAAATEEAARVAPRGVKDGKGRRKLGTRDTITGEGSTVRGRVQGTPPGAWAWITSGTSPHLVGVGQRRARAPRYLKGPRYSHPVRGPVAHPGARQMGAWRRVQDRAARVVPAIFADQVAEACRAR